MDKEDKMNANNLDGMMLLNAMLGLMNEAKEYKKFEEAKAAEEDVVVEI